VPAWDAGTANRQEELMSRKPRLYLAVVAVLAVTALVPASSSAAQFHWTNTKTIVSTALDKQVFTFNAGAVKCTNAAGFGEPSLSAQILDLTVSYSSCTAFGLGGVKVSPVTYRYHADGHLDLLTPLTIRSELGGCEVIVSAQNGLTAVSYTNNYNRLIEKNAVGGISYTTKGSGICGSGGTNGALTGSNEWEQLSGSIAWEK